MKMEGRKKLEREAEEGEGVRRVRGKNMKQVERRQEESEITKDKETKEVQKLEEDCKRGMQMKEGEMAPREGEDKT